MSSQPGERPNQAAASADELLSSRLRRYLPGLALLSLNLLALCVLSVFAFQRNRGLLVIGNDGPTLIAIARDQLEYAGISAAFHGSPLQGLGDLSGIANLTLLKPLLRPVYESAGAAAPALLYTFFAVVAFLTVLLVGWNHGFARGTRYAAAWVLTILLLPFFDHFRVYPVSASAPQFMVYLLAAALADTGIWRMGRGGLAQTARCAALLLLAALVMLVLSPPAIVLLLPYLCLAFLVSLAAAPAAERRRQLLGAAAVVAALGALGWIEYAAGMVLYTNSGFFLKEMVAAYPPDRQFASILFQGTAGADRAVGPWLFCAASMGAALALRGGRRSPLFHAAALQTLGQVALAGVGGWLMTTIVPWTGPPFVYCEMMFFALYALFSVDLVARCCGRLVPRLAALPPALRTASAYGLPVLAALLLAGAVGSLPGRPRNSPFDYAVPPSATPLTEVLEREIGLDVGRDFAGRVVNVIPLKDRDVQFPYFRYLNVLTRNDHQTSGLWFRDIPTLHAYNQFISPAFHRLITRFLAAPGERQHRVWTNFSLLDFPTLRLLGVRFLLTTERFLPGTSVRGGLSFPGGAPVPPLYLHDLGAANVAGVAASKAVTARTISEAEEIMGRNGFDPRLAVVMDPSGTALVQAEALRPALSSRITVEKGAWRVRARSDGRTLLVLPLEYSRCIDVVPVSGAAPSIVRADVALTGLLFEREVDALLANRIGPFVNPRCRFRDFRDFRALWQEGRLQPK